MGKLLQPDTPVPKPDVPTPLGISTHRVSTAEQARPVPYFVGIGRMACTFVTDAFDIVTENINEDVGKDSRTVGYNYFCSFAAIVCLGPVDVFNALFLDDNLVWNGDLVRGSEDYVDITVEGYGSLRWYWGTDTQEIDDLLAESGVAHPGYRGQCYAVFTHWLLGKDRTTVPNIEFLMVRKPEFDFIDEGVITGEANPVIPFLEWWTNTRYGLGLPLDHLNTDLIAETAETLLAEGLGISPLVSQAATLSTLLAAILDTIDGFVAQDTGGLWYIGLNRPPDPDPDPESETVGTLDLVDVPELATTEWATTINEVFVRFRNRNYSFDEDAISWRERANFAIFGSIRTQTITRDWVTRQIVAWAMAASICKQQSRPYVQGTILVRWRVGLVLTPGTQFIFTYLPSGIDGIRCRVLEWSQSKSDDSHLTLRFIEDRSDLNIPATAVTADELPDEVTYDTTDVFASLISELPFGVRPALTYHLPGSVNTNVVLDDGAPTVAIIMPARGDSLTTRFNVYNKSGAASYFANGGAEKFGLVGTLVADYPATVGYDDPTVKIRLVMTGNERFIPDLNHDYAFEAGPMLLFAGNEILRFYDPVVVAPDTYELKIIRAAFGSEKVDHFAGDVFWLMKGPLIWNYISFTYASVGTAILYKIQPVGISGPLDLTVITPVTLTVNQRMKRPFAPANAMVNGDPWNPTYGTGDDIIVNWTETGDLWEKASEFDAPHTRADATAIQIRDLSDALKATILLAGVVVGPHTISNADLVAALGSETDFRVRVYYSLAMLLSIGYTGVEVAKV